MNTLLDHFGHLESYFVKVSGSHSVRCPQLHLAATTWTFILLQSWAEFHLTTKIYKLDSKSKMLIHQVISFSLFFLGRFFIKNLISLIDIRLLRFSILLYFIKGAIL